MIQQTSCKCQICRVNKQKQSFQDQGDSKHHITVLQIFLLTEPALHRTDQLPTPADVLWHRRDPQTSPDQRICSSSGCAHASLHLSTTHSCTNAPPRSTTRRILVNIRPLRIGQRNASSPWALYHRHYQTNEQSQAMLHLISSQQTSYHSRNLS